MKTIRNSSWRYLLSFAALGFIVALAFMNQPQVMSLVIDPVTRLSWLVMRSLLMVDQEIYWTVLIFVILAFGLGLVPAQPSIRRPAPYTAVAGPENRAAEWEQLFRRAAEGEDGRQALQKALDDLHEGLIQAAGEDEVINVKLPPFKKKWLPHGFHRQAGWLLQKAVGRRTPLENEFESRVRQILDQLESMMERKNDQE